MPSEKPLPREKGGKDSFRGHPYGSPRSGRGPRQSAVVLPVATSNSSIAGINIAIVAKAYAPAIAKKTQWDCPSRKLVIA